MTCPDCERYKKSASMWRNKAYEASGHSLPWEPDELWQGLTDEELRECLGPELVRIPPGWRIFSNAIEAKLKEKNT